MFPSLEVSGFPRQIESPQYGAPTLLHLTHIPPDPNVLSNLSVCPLLPDPLLRPGTVSSCFCFSRTQKRTL